MLAVAVVVLTLILLLTFFINGPTRMLTSEELALEQTRISLNIFIKQTEVASTSTAGLYLTLGVPFPTETPFIVPTSGSLGKPTRTATPISTSDRSGTPRVSNSTVKTPIIVNTRPYQNATSPGGQFGMTDTATSPSNTETKPSSFWQGEWISYHFQNKFKAGILTTTVTGNTVTGNVNFIDGSELSLTGAISLDENSVTGNYTGTDRTGSFYWQKIDKAQFGGNTDNTEAFCATQKVGMLSRRCLINNP